jgi:hypothetical protein
VAAGDRSGDHAGVDYQANSAAVRLGQSRMDLDDNWVGDAGEQSSACTHKFGGGGGNLAFA